MTDQSIDYTLSFISKFESGALFSQLGEEVQKKYADLPSTAKYAFARSLLTKADRIEREPLWTEQVRTQQRNNLIHLSENIINDLVCLSSQPGRTV